MVCGNTAPGNARNSVKYAYALRQSSFLDFRRTVAVKNLPLPRESCLHPLGEKPFSRRKAYQNRARRHAPGPRFFLTRAPFRGMAAVERRQPANDYPDNHVSRSAIWYRVLPENSRGNQKNRRERKIPCGIYFLRLWPASSPCLSYTLGISDGRTRKASTNSCAPRGNRSSAK